MESIADGTRSLRKDLRAAGALTERKPAAVVLGDIEPTYAVGAPVRVCCAPGLPYQH